jgi:putative sterol carrier protein
VTGADDPTGAFFDRLTRRGHDPLLEHANGAVRFDITDGGRTDRWLVTIDHGDVSAARADAGGTCVVYADRDVFNGMVTGEVNGMAAMLRGAIRFDGDMELIVLVRRLFPGRPAAATKGVRA